MSDSFVQSVLKSVQALTSVYQMYKSLQVSLRWDNDLIYTGRGGGGFFRTNLS